jgi:hypothetical protein
LRLEIARCIDKEKSELYFYFSVKKFLTEKAKRACPQAAKISVFIRARSHPGVSAFPLLLRTANVPLPFSLTCCAR